MYVASELSSRNEFGRLLTERGCERAVEIGTHRGDFAKILLTDWGGHLTCVDPWEDTESYKESQTPLLWDTDGDRQKDFEAAACLLQPFQDCVHLRRATSLIAVEEFKDSSLDFVYIDGDHFEKEVFRDLQAWWPKIKNNGILAGHDIITPGELDGWGKGVQRAMKNFIHSQVLGEDFPIYLIVEENNLPWSYYLVKE